MIHDITLTSAASLASDIAVRAPKNNIRGAAEDFEALLLQQMIASARREAETGSTDSGSDGIMDLSEQLLSKALVSGGGLGLARLIASQARTESVAMPDPAAAPASRDAGSASRR